MKRGDAAREAAKNTIIEAFGDAYVTTADKKIYVNVKDGPGGEVLQMAISMTIPKTPIGKPAENDGGAFPAMSAAPATELSKEDRSEVERLLRELDIS